MYRGKNDDLFLPRLLFGVQQMGVEVSEGAVARRVTDIPHSTFSDEEIVRREPITVDMVCTDIFIGDLDGERGSGLRKIYRAITRRMLVLELAPPPKVNKVRFPTHNRRDTRTKIGG